MHACNEEDRCLGKTHEEVSDCKINDKNVGWRPQASAPAHTHIHTQAHKHKVVEILSVILDY